MKKIGVLLLVLGFALIYSSLLIIADNDDNSQIRNNECTTTQNCIDIGKCSQGVECSCYKNKCYAGYFVKPDDSDNDDDNETEGNDSDDDEIEIEDNEFCGTSTKADCKTDSNCITSGCSGEICGNMSDRSNTGGNCLWKDCYNNEKYNQKCGCFNNKCQWKNKNTNQEKARNLTKEEIKEIIRERNRLKFENRTGVECPEDCTCTGVVMKCQLENGREMTIIAGKSGNIIIQHKSFNASTNVELYKSNGTVYGVFKNNITREIKVLPEDLQQKILEKLKAKLDQANVTLDENGVYKIKFQKKARVFFIFPVKEDISADVDSSTGEFVVIKKPWWRFFAKEVNDSE